MSGFNHIATINSTISKVNHRLSILKEIFKYANFHNNLILNNSLNIRVIGYYSLILFSSSNNLILKLQVLLMKCSCPILGYKSFKFSTQKFMNQLKWLTADKLITKELILFIHKTIINNQLKAISDHFTFSLHDSNNLRPSRKLLISEEHDSKTAQKSLINFENL